MRFEFAIRSGRESGRTVAVDSGQALTFGRMKNCDVQLDDEAVSRRHCTLHGRDQGCVVADLQSANGTFVNDRRVSTAELHPGDTVRMGSTVLEFLGGSEDRSLPQGMSTARLSVTPAEGSQTVIRRSVDPSKLEFLTAAFNQKDELPVLESVHRYVTTLHKVSELMSRATSVEALFDSILSAILDATGGDRAAILMRAQGHEKEPDADVNVMAVRARTGEASPRSMTLSHTIVNDVLEHGISTFSHDALSDERYGAGESVVRQRIRSVMCSPMRTTDAILGVLYVDSQSASQFSETELELLAAIGNQAGMALHRARLVGDMERMFLDVMKAIAALIDAKDGYTHRHSERVAGFAVKIARELGLSSDVRGIVELSALLHDVGKIGVPDAILNKPAGLTPEEFAEMRQHPIHGAAILSNIQSERIAELLPGVKYHHERWDGSGYPEGLKGEEIPLLGRILAVADALDALTSDRAYRKAVSFDEVVEMLQKQAGSAFDPTVVQALTELHHRGDLALPMSPGPALR